MVSAFDALSTCVHRSQDLFCLQTRISVLSVASVESERSISDVSSRTLESVTSALSKSSDSEASTGSNGSGSATLVGEEVGGVLGVISLVSIGVVLCVLCRRHRRARLATQQPLLSQQPSYHPITPTSLTFPTNSNYIGGPPVTNAAQPGWRPEQSAPFALSGATAVGQTSFTSHQFASTSLDVNTRTQGVSVIQQDNYGGLAFGSLPAEGSADPRESYGNTIRGPTHAAAPMTFPCSAFEALEGAPTPPPRYSTAPPVYEPLVSENTGSLQP